MKNNNEEKYFKVGGVPIKFRVTQKGKPRFESWDTKNPTVFSPMEVYNNGVEISKKEFNELVSKFRN